MLMHGFQPGGGRCTRYRTAGSQNVLPPAGETPILERWGNAGSPLDGLPSKLCAMPDLSGRLRMDGLQPSVVSAKLYAPPKRTSVPIVAAACPEAATVVLGRLTVVAVPLRMPCSAAAAHSRQPTGSLSAIFTNDHQGPEHGMIVFDALYAAHREPQCKTLM